MEFPDRHVGVRIFEIIRLIQEGRYPSVDTIMRRFECSKRTAERYIEKIRDLVAEDLIYDRRRRGYCFARGGPDLPPFRLSEGEVAAIFLATRLFEQCRGTPYERAVGRALSKLKYLFPEEVTLNALDQPTGWVSFRMEPLRGEERQVLEAFIRLNEARESRETVRLSYFTASRREWREREIDPYHLHFHEGAWYVFAYCHWRRQVKIFALDRMAFIQTTGRTFEIPESFSVQDFMADSFRIERGEPADVAIRFAPQQTPYVKGKQWHQSQSIETLDDGGLILRMRVGGLGEVKRWVLSFGAGAEALEPEELRDAVAQDVEALARAYGVAVGGEGELLAGSSGE